MNFITVNKEKCLHDGICASICVHGVLAFDQSNKLPYSVEGMEQKCVSCGHCISVCPTGAFSHSQIPLEKCKELKNDWRSTPEQVEQLLKGRRSIRKFKKQIVDKDVLTKIIDIARYAPTGYNVQPEKWIVLHDSKEVKKVCEITINMMRECVKNNLPVAAWLNMPNLIQRYEEGIDVICNGAPHLVLTYAPKEIPIAQDSCKMALTYMELTALSFGLGTCWAGFVHLTAMMTTELNETLQIPEGHQIFGAMMIGYPKYEVYRIPLRKEPQILWK